MRITRRLAVGGSLALASLPLSVVFAASKPKFALLIGNKDYPESVGALRNPVNDVTLVAKGLYGLGFTKDNVKVLKNAKRADTMDPVRAHASALKTAGDNAIGFFYYSGHGVANADDGKNYLVPVDVRSSTSAELWDDSIDIANVFAELQKAGAGMQIVAIDACRSQLRLANRALGDKGFTAMRDEGRNALNMFISYATWEGNVASDGDDNARNGPYALALAKTMAKGSERVNDAFDEVRRAVRRATGGAQEPMNLDRLSDEGAALTLAGFAATSGGVQLADTGEHVVREEFEGPASSGGQVAEGPPASGSAGSPGENAGNGQGAGPGGPAHGPAHVYTLYYLNGSSFEPDGRDQTHLALVVGNSNYGNPHLDLNNKGDAKVVADALRRSSFWVSERSDMTCDRFRLSLAEMVERLKAHKGEAVAVLYFSGYGFGIGGHNYLLPADVTPQSAEQMVAQGIALPEIIHTLSQAEAQGVAIFLDAARPVPISTSGLIPRGMETAMEPNAAMTPVISQQALMPANAAKLDGSLAVPTKKKGIVAAYSCQPGQYGTAVNKDGVSVYASALAQSIASPARRALQDLLAEVSNTVFQQTFGAQLPYFQDAKRVPIYFRDASGLRA